MRISVRTDGLRVRALVMNVFAGAGMELAITERGCLTVIASPTSPYHGLDERAHHPTLSGYTSPGQSVGGAIMPDSTG